MLFTMLPTISTKIPVATVAQADIEYLTDYDPSSYEHWIFDKGGAGGLVGRKAGKVLVPQSDAPGYAAAYLSVSPAMGKGLLTDIVESANAEDTICAVVQDSHAGAQLSWLWGNFATGSGGGGAAFNVASPDRSLHGFYSPVAVSANSGLKIDSTKFYFVAISRSFSGPTKRVRMYVGGLGSLDVTAATTYTSAARPTVIGNGYHSSTVATTAKNYAELAAYQRFMSTTDLQAVYLRAKARMAARGITVF